MIDKTELHNQLIAHIARRDRVTTERAKAILATLSPPDLIRLELEARPSRPRFEAEYDPYSR
jgi:hypothetical protein